MNNPNVGLPEHLFEYVSSITPMVNVDLIIYNSNNEVLFTWREDKFYGPGWHIPGGIVRYKENFLNRINIVAKDECNCKKLSSISLIDIYQVMNPYRSIRGHFISFLFKAKFTSELNTTKGKIEWFKTVPDNILKQQRKYIKSIHKIMTEENISEIDLGNIMDDYGPENE